jgi:hypothetical protein
MTRIANLLLLMSGVMVIASCAKEERDACLQPRTTFLRAHAYRHADTGSAVVDTLLPYPLLIPITGGATQYYYGGVKRIGKFALSLSESADSSRWIIRPDSANFLQDTLTFHYERQLRFLSNACGYTHFYNLQRVSTTRHALDSAIILRGDITSDANVEHLKLIY